eukprot:CAMPEP_0195017562 /NCGR_PEP_ID=MMETSP0326_2-20130528/27814_1 /TAXON_ID=2866 ORGANISM="Crypthecodinium cohnii, Strain Seligo" /NCGR_SAMPLE_ID=MMETSP0326_2 /ASSEMBLY_ACC=CAM_ASM_000348 /LENGTH=80 /DNA_ID=CAMNT_0040034275 /DNA_START=79 /DNA_END=318 /DNA_ORIENTATION=+
MNPSLLLVLALALSVEEGLAVLVELDLGDDHLGGFDADGNGLAVHLVTGHALDVDAPLLAVDSDDLALTLLELTTGDHHL